MYWITIMYLICQIRVSIQWIFLSDKIRASLEFCKIDFSFIYVCSSIKVLPDVLLGNWSIRKLWTYSACNTPDDSLQHGIHYLISWRGFKRKPIKLCSRRGTETWRTWQTHRNQPGMGLICETETSDYWSSCGPKQKHEFKWEKRTLIANLKLIAKEKIICLWSEWSWRCSVQTAQLKWCAEC